MEGRERAGKHRLTGRMSAPHAARALCACATLLLVHHLRHVAATEHPSSAPQEPMDSKTIRLFDGVSVNIPKEANSTDRLISFQIDTNRSLETGRGSKKSKSTKKLMERILPMFIMPFLIQSTIVPFFLSMLKFMLFKSMMVGKLALALIFFNAFRNHNSVKGRDAQMADAHYGYHDNGMEYGAYFN